MIASGWSQALTILCAALFIRPLTAERYTARLERGSKHCFEVSFPKWQAPDDYPAWHRQLSLQSSPRSSLGHFEFRSVEGVEDEVLVSAFVVGEIDGQRHPSRSYYAFRLNQRGKARPIDFDEWNRGSPLAQIRHAGPGPSPAAPVTDFRLTESGLVHKEKVLRKSGPKWSLISSTPIRVSFGGRYVALFSYDGNVDADDPFDFSLGALLRGNPIKGSYFVDVYNTESGRRPVAIRGSFQGSPAHDIQETSFWLKRHHYVLPLSIHGMNKILVCDVSAADPANQPARSGKSR